MILRARVSERVSLRQFLRSKWRFSSRLIKELAREKKVFIDGKSRRMNYMLPLGADVLVDLGWETNTYEPHPVRVDILFEDEGMLIINKDHLQSVHPSGAHRTDTVLNAIAYYQTQSAQSFKIRFAHRLDRDTSGALIIAKNKWIHEELARQFREGRVVRKYLALCHGEVQESFEVKGEMSLADDGIRREFREGGKISHTIFLVKKTERDWSLVEAIPLTGRTHQIRVHLASKGFPIFGDTLYGIDDQAPRQMLHSHQLEFTHPLTGASHLIEAPLKEDFLQEMEQLTK